MKKGKEYELLVEQIYKEIGDSATIKQDEFIIGKIGIPRQIDLTIRHVVAGEEILIIVQAKDWKHKADVNVVGEFKSVMEDVSAEKGILICRSGFTKPAIKYAKQSRISVYSAHSNDNKDWMIELTLPVYKCLDCYETQIGFGITFTGVSSLEADLTKNCRHNGKEYSMEEFLHQHMPPMELNKTGERTVMRATVEGLETSATSLGWIPIDYIDFIYTFKQTTYEIAKISLEEYRAIKDHELNKIVHSYVKFDEVAPLILDPSNWKKITRQQFNEDVREPSIFIEGVNLGGYINCNVELKK